MFQRGFNHQPEFLQQKKGFLQQNDSQDSEQIAVGAMGCLKQLMDGGILERKKWIWNMNIKHWYMGFNRHNEWDQSLNYRYTILCDLIVE